MRLRSILLLSCCLALSGCAVGPRGHGAPFGLFALGAGIAIGSVLTTLPPRHVVVDDRTYYSDGVFYKDTPGGYVVVTPTPGVWVDDIPEAHRVVRHKGKDYCVYKGVWYRFDSKQKRYRVIDNPIKVEG